MSTKTIFNTLTALAVAATLTVGLAACVQTPEKTPVEKPTATAPATEAPAAIDPLDLDGNGSVSEFEKQIAAQNAIRDYTLPDGTVVKVDPTKPLPEPVKAAVKDDMAGTMSQIRTAQGDARNSVLQAVKAVLLEQEAATGRGVAAVYQAMDADKGLIWGMMASGEKYAPFMASTDKAAFVAQAQAWADNRGFELIVF